MTRIPQDRLESRKIRQLKCYPPLFPLTHHTLTSFLIFCFLFFVTVEPSWWAVGCFPDYEFKPEEFWPERHGVKVSVIGWERRRWENSSWQLDVVSKPHTHTEADPPVERISHNRHKRTKPLSDLRTHQRDFNISRHCHDCFVSSDKTAHYEADMYTTMTERKGASKQNKFTPFKTQHFLLGGLEPDLHVYVNTRVLFSRAGAITTWLFGSIRGDETTTYNVKLMSSSYSHVSWG